MFSPEDVVLMIANFLFEFSIKNDLTVKKILVDEKKLNINYLKTFNIQKNSHTISKSRFSLVTCPEMRQRFLKFSIQGLFSLCVLVCHLHPMKIQALSMRLTCGYFYIVTFAPWEFLFLFLLKLFLRKLNWLLLFSLQRSSIKFMSEVMKCTIIKKYW